jgi:citrate lyase beta subunit
MDIDYTRFNSLKGEFEAEGLTHNDIASEAIFAAHRGLEYLVKIGGCEARADLNFLADLGISSIVAPMIETGFAMRKYMGMLPPGVFRGVGVTIETITAVSNISDILTHGNLLTSVTIGRTDLTASWNGQGVESAHTIQMVKSVARAARAAGLETTMGGSVSRTTRALLQDDSELRALLDFIETRKTVMEIEQFMDEETLSHAFSIEDALLERRAQKCEHILPAIQTRRLALTKRG